MNFQELLVKHKACAEARAWVADKTAEQAWEQCPHAEWMLWLVSEIVREQELKQEIVRAVADIARTALGWTTDRRVRDCIAAVERWLAGELVDLQVAEATALNAVCTVAWTAEAALAAAWAASAAANAAQAANAQAAADCGTIAAARVAECTPTGNQHADIVRKHLPWNLTQPLLERAMQDTL